MHALLTAALLNSAALTALVTGTDGQARISWEALPTAAALPAVTLYVLPSVDPEYTMTGRTNLQVHNVQISAWAGDLAAALAVRDAIAAFGGPIGELLTPPLQAFIRRRHGGWQRASGPDANRAIDIYRASLDLELWETLS
jgi:hypothetical protein